MNCVYKKLNQYNQMHLLRHLDILSHEQKENLFNQIDKVNFSIICEKEQGLFDEAEIEPIVVLKADTIAANIASYMDKGIDYLKNNKVGLVLLSGGQGSRLGGDKPKGLLDIGIIIHLTLFQVLIDEITNTAKKINNLLYLFIMVSNQNKNEIVKYFKDNHYFGYNEEYIYFFQQETLPSVDFDGKILLADKDRLYLLPDGNGGWYDSLVKTGCTEIIDQVKIEWLNVFSVDNPLQKIADPAFIGATINSNCNCGAKVVKKSMSEKVGTICLKNGKPYLVEYHDLPQEMIEAKDELGNIKYGYGVTLNYLFKISQLKKIDKNILPLHKVKKKIEYFSDAGYLLSPTEPNAYKLEYMITDMIQYMDTCLPYEVIREREFAPIKNKSGIDSLELAQKLLIQNGYKI